MKKFAIAALVGATAFIATSALAKDWSQMNLKERLAWAEAYGNAHCPYGMKVSKADQNREAEIMGPLAFQWAVKVHMLAYDCNPAPAWSAKR